MTPQQVRQARIANSKARSAAIKALKEQAAEAPAAAPATPAASPTAEQAAPPAAGIPEPDYIEITDDMPADEVRKARIHNARARSAYMKALKEAGVEPGAATPEQPQAQQQAPPSQAAPVIPDVEPPNYIEISDEMSPDELRKARVQNARERSRFYKALKERGIDPKEYEAAQEAGEPTPAPAAQPQQEAAAPAEAAEPVEAAAADGGGVEIPAHITEPDYIEITDDMPADEMRRARVHNARERSRYAKALKDAGIDPKEVIG
jgi:Arc/MetJ family transcription regulator